MSAIETISKICVEIDRLTREFDTPRAIIFGEEDWMRFTTDPGCVPYVSPYTDKKGDSATKIMGVPVFVVRAWKGPPQPIDAKTYEQIIDRSAAFARRVKLQP